MLSRSRIRAAAGILTAAALVPACRPGAPGTGCKAIDITASPGRFVDGASGQELELVARVTHDGKGVEGLPVRFAFGFNPPDRPAYGSVLDEVTTDATGTAVLRRTMEQLSFDRALAGEIDPEYRARWDEIERVDGVVYCRALASNTLPLEQFPPKQGG